MYSSDPDAFANIGARGGQKFQRGLATGPVVFCSGLSANGSAFLQQMSLDELVPVQLDDQLGCPREHEHVFFVDEAAGTLNCFSLVSGSSKELFSLDGYVPQGASMTSL